MKANLPIKGFWWLPENPDCSCFGTLDGGHDPRLSLECYTRPEETLDLSNSVTGIIHGNDESKRPVTVLSAILHSCRAPGGITTTVLHPGCALIGAHVTNKQSFSAQTVHLNLQHLYGWLGMSGFQTKDVSDQIGVVDFSHVSPDPVSHRTDGDLSISFSLDMEHEMTMANRHVREDALVTINCRNGIDYTNAVSIADDLRMLLHFATLKPIYVKNMSFRGLVDEHFGITGRRERDEVIVRTPDFRGTPTPDTFMIFQYEDVAGDFGGFFHNWLEFQKRHREALDCYVTTVYHNLPITVEHICLSQALDAIHGSLFNSHSARDYKKKIEELCRRYPEALNGIVADISDFAERVRDTRDYYTHRNPKDLEERNVEREFADLVHLNEKMALLFRACVLRENGIPAKNISRLRCHMAKEIIEW